METTAYLADDIENEARKRIKAARAVLASRSLLNFTTFTFNDFKFNWHHQLICDELDAWIAAEQPYNLMLFAPPRHGKTELCARRLVPYMLGRNPNAEVIMASYGAELVTDNSRDIKRIMRSDEYRMAFPKTRLAGPRERSDNLSRTNAFDVIDYRGKYRAAGIGGAIVGRGADFGIIDDPLKGRAQAESKTIRDTCINWYKSDFSTRLYKHSRVLMILTRWHHNDLAGWCIEQMKTEPNASQWRVVNFPAMYEEQEYKHEQDERNEDEALWPERFPLSFLQRQKSDLGMYDWNSLYQGRPDLPGGSVFKRWWANEIDRNQVPAGLMWVRYWDLAVTKKTKADHTASVRVAIDNEQNIYVGGYIRMQEEWPTVYRHFKHISNAERIAVGVESQGTQKGFFQSMIEDKELANIAIIAYDESKDKLTRALPWIARAQAGKFYVLKENGMNAYIDELTAFTGLEDDHDDQVDATSGAYRMLQQYTQPKVTILGEYT